MPQCQAQPNTAAVRGSAPGATLYMYVSTYNGRPPRQRAPRCLAQPPTAALRGSAPGAAICMYYISTYGRHASGRRSAWHSHPRRPCTAAPPAQTYTRVYVRPENNGWPPCRRAPQCQAQPTTAAVRGFAPGAALYMYVSTYNRLPPRQRAPRCLAQPPTAAMRGSAPGAAIYMYYISTYGRHASGRRGA